MKVSDLFVKCLENEGVQYVFGIAGEENLDILESLRTSKIKFVSVRHEQSAGFMAATVGRLTGKIGVCLSTLGPGATNFVTAAAYAKLGAMPMLMITGQKPIKTAPQGGFQIIDVVGMMKPLTKFSKQLVHRANTAVTVRKAVQLAEEERPGPVHIEVPMDIAEDDTESMPLPVAKTRRPIAEQKAINWAIEMIKNAKKPLLLVGAGANRKLVSKMLTEFVDQTGMYFFNTQMGKGVIDERHAKFLGTAAITANDYLHLAVDQADLIINVGHDVIEKPPFVMKNGGTKVIHINFYHAEVDQIYFPEVDVVGDVANAIWQIKEGLQGYSGWDFAEFEKIKQLVDKRTADFADSPNFPLLPQRIVADVRKAMPDDGILALDNGMYKLWFARSYKAYQPNTLLLDNALATMGAGLPSGIAAKLISPGRKVLVVAGDGGFMMNSQEIETAMRLGLDIAILIVRDDAYGMIKWKQAADGFNDYGLDHSNPDFVKYAESYGATGLRVESVEDLLPKLQQALSTKGVTLIDCPIDYSENLRLFNQELKNKNYD